MKGRSGRDNIDPALLAKIDKSEKDGGIFLKEVANGSLVKVHTQNSEYVLTPIRGKGETRVAIVGGRYIPRPMVAFFRGSTFGGSMIKIGWLGKGMHLEVNLLGGGLLSTSSIQSIVIEHSSHEAIAMIELAERDAPRLATEEEVRRSIEKFMEDHFPAEIREEAWEMVKRFSLNGQIAISSVLFAAYSKGKFGDALELLKKFYQKHWAYQPPAKHRS